MSKSSRRVFLERLGAAGMAAASGAILAACGAKPTPELVRVATAAPSATVPIPTSASPSTATAMPVPPTDEPAAEPSPLATATPAPAYLAVAHGADAAENTRRAIAALGGIEQLVKPGADVIVKPNICNAYYPAEYAATTNPDVVAAIVQLCLGAGARRVRVMDQPFGGTAPKAYAISGIEDAVVAVGGQMELLNKVIYRDVDIPEGRLIDRWSVYGDILDADVVINVPIAKTHGNTRLTLGMKNLMGIIQDRNGFHARGLDQCIADLSTVVRPQLTVMDATRILVRNGPTGGNLDDVVRKDTIIASRDVVAADAYATILFDMSPADIGYIQYGAEMGLGRTDLDALSIAHIEV